MTLEELQLIADTAWIILGNGIGHEFNITVIEDDSKAFITVNVTGYTNDVAYILNETFNRLDVESKATKRDRFDTTNTVIRYKYIKTITSCIRSAIRSLHTEQIRNNIVKEQS